MASMLGWLLAIIISLGAALLCIPHELWKRWREPTVERLDHAVRRRVSRFDRRYREFVLTGLRFIDLKGLATVGFYTPELDEVFVDVSLAYRAPQEVPESVLAQLPTTERHTIGDFLDGQQAMVLAVIGAAGSGPSNANITSSIHVRRAAATPGSRVSRAALPGLRSSDSINRGRWPGVGRVDRAS